MYHDVTDLRDFYYRSALGRSVQKRLQQTCRQFWPEVDNEIVAGFGFASPLLRPFLSEASHVVSLMPAEQGVMAWPPGERNVSTLCTETMWPLGASSVDRLIMLHAIENASSANAVLKEAWRVLAPEGRMIVIFANRMGIWSTNETTPFGQGRPFALAAFEAVLAAHHFMVSKREGALYGSPWRSAFGLRVSNWMEWAGEKSRGRFLAGVWVIEAQKSDLNKPILAHKREPIFASPDLRPASAVNRAGLQKPKI